MIEYKLDINIFNLKTGLRLSTPEKKTYRNYQDQALFSLKKRQFFAQFCQKKVSRVPLWLSHSFFIGNLQLHSPSP